MNEGLYFVPIIAQALKAANPEVSLQDAFGMIKEMGSQQQYYDGYVNFEHFIDIAFSHFSIWQAEGIHWLICEMAAGVFEGPGQEEEMLLDRINSHAEWKADYQKLCNLLDNKDSMHSFSPVFQILNREGLAGNLYFKKDDNRKSVTDVYPGVYVLKLLNTGRIIWQGEFTSEQLIWNKAYGTRYLDMAAETENIEQKPTGQITVWDGTVIIRTFAGIESGSIEVELSE